MPIIPYIEDKREDLEKLIKRSKNSGADFILFAPGLTLRDSQKEFFIKKLEQSQYRSYTKSILNLYNKNSDYDTSHKYLKEKNQEIFEICKKNDLKIRVKRWLPNDYRKWNYKIAEMILNKEYIQSIHGKKDLHMRFAGLYLNNLKESILNVFRRGELSNLKNFNKKLIRYSKPILQKIDEKEKSKGFDRFI